MAAHEIIVDGYEPFLCQEDKTVFRRMCEIRAGHKHHGCCGGGCGVCRMKILSGDYEIVSRMSRAHVSEGDEDNDIVLLCCVKPRSDLKIGFIKN